MVSKSTGIENYPVSPTDFTNTCVLYVPDLAGVRRKIIRKTQITI